MIDNEYHFNIFLENINKYDENFHKNFIENLFNHPLPSYFDPDETSHLVNYWSKRSWYYDFIIPLLSNKELKNKQVIIGFTYELKVNTKQEFLNILKNIKFYLKDFFNLNFHKFDYTDEEKEDIKKIFSFNDKLLNPKYFTYEEKRDIFDYFGIIPCLLYPKSYDLDHREFRLFLKYFQSLTVVEQSEIIFNKYSGFHLKDPSYCFIPFVEKFTNEYINIIEFISKNATTIKEKEFLLQAKPIVESIYLKHNINDF